MSTQSRRHVLSILVEDRFGELARIVGLFSGRGFNIDTLAANKTLDPRFSKVVLTTRGDDRIIEQIIKQLHKLIRVRRVHHMTDEKHLEREMCLVTVRVASQKAREDLERIIRLVGARIVAYAPHAFTLEVTAPAKDIENFLELVRPMGIKDMVRSATLVLSRPDAEPDAEAAQPAA